MSHHSVANDAALTAPPEKKGCGCGLVSGCLGLIAVLVIGLLIAAAIGSVKLRGMLTSADPVPITAIAISDQVKLTAEDKRQQLREAVATGKAISTVLTTPELNVLAHGGDDSLKDRFALELEDDGLVVHFSAPLEEIPGCAGRWINGSMTVSVTCENGVLEIFASKATVNGKALPEWLMRELRTRNLAEKVYENQEARDVLKRLRQIVIEDGVMRIATNPSL